MPAYAIELTGTVKPINRLDPAHQLFSNCPWGCIVWQVSDSDPAVRTKIFESDAAVSRTLNYDAPVGYHLYVEAKHVPEASP